MSAAYHRTKAYLAREKKRCRICGHHGRDIRIRVSKEKGIWLACNNCCIKHEIY